MSERDEPQVPIEQIGDTPDDVTSENEALEKDGGLVSPGSTATGAGTSLGSVPTEAETLARPVDEGLAAKQERPEELVDGRFGDDRVDWAEGAETS